VSAVQTRRIEFVDGLAVAPGEGSLEGSRESESPTAAPPVA